MKKKKKEMKVSAKMKSRMLISFSGEAAYYDRYLSCEGEQTLEVLELSLSFCFDGHDIRRPL